MNRNLLCVLTSFALLCPTYSKAQDGLYVYDNGYVGIGEDEPISRLSFGNRSGGDFNTGGGRFAVSQNSSNQYFYGLGLASESSIYGLGLWGGTNSASPWNGSTGEKPHLFIAETTGRVGIGTMTPSYDCHVIGESYFSSKVGIGSFNSSYMLTVGGYALANDWQIPSDIALKDNIQPLEGSLHKLSQLSAVTFDWKGSKEHSIGVTAQDVETVFPELVRTSTDTGIKSVNYSKLMIPLIEAVKEQQQQIEALQSRLSSLEARAGIIK